VGSQSGSDWWLGALLKATAVVGLWVEESAVQSLPHLHFPAGIEN